MTATPPETSPSAAWLIDRAAQIGAMLRQEQDATDARGVYSEAIHRELQEGGFYRILQPRMFGGFGTDCETYADRSRPRSSRSRA
jgi:3-hydroxy-9,10-secoandrosta-1,3,5(10)-triene-9,17-dione monooxygenase